MAGRRVEVEVRVSAPPATVWRCLTESPLFARWLDAAATIDARHGGAVHVDFARHGVVVAGVVDEFEAGAALGFTWGVASGRGAEEIPPESSHVRITVASAPEGAGGTEVALVHSGLRTEKLCEDHLEGWASYLGNLAALAPVAAIDGGPEALWDRWFAAWGETDAAARGRLVAQCVGPDATFRDTHADVSGPEAISAWIDACQRMFPGVRLRRDGAVMHTRGALLAEWSAVGADGAVMARGINHGRVGADGRLASVEGFWRTGR
jgi:uncharacterized protein YndB with AHSA1/START domain